MKLREYPPRNSWKDHTIGLDQSVRVTA